MVPFHWNNTLFWFWANQSLLLLLNVVCLAEKQTPVLYVGFAQPRLEHTIYHTQGEYANP